MSKATRILVVEDNAGNRAVVSSLLRSRGFEVVEANDGEQALAVIAEQSIELVMLDLMMPKLSGYDVIENLKSNEATASIPVIILTVRDEENDIIEGYQKYSCDYYITKPFSSSKLLNAIQTVLSANRGQHIVDKMNPSAPSE